VGWLSPEMHFDKVDLLNGMELDGIGCKLNGIVCKLISLDFVYGFVWFHENVTIVSCILSPQYEWPKGRCIQLCIGTIGCGIEGFEFRLNEEDV